MTAASDDVWEVMSTARTIRRFTDEQVDDATLTRCLDAARWAPSGANAQGSSCGHRRCVRWWPGPRRRR